MMAGATMAMADSYTIVFKDAGADADGSAAFNAETAVADFVAEGQELVAGINTENATYTYLGKQGCGIKLGSGKAAGNLVLNLSAAAQVNATSAVINAAAWKEGEAAPATVNGVVVEGGITNLSFADYTCQLDGQTLTTLTLSGVEKGRYYVKSITINYEAVTETFDAALAHAPRYEAGKLYENILGPDMIATKTKTNAETGAVDNKPGISNKYQWIQYVNPTSTLDDGTAEVQQSNRWTNYNPAYEDYNYGEGGNWIQVTGLNGSVQSPVLSSAWGKYVVLYVKETSKVELLGIGSASGSEADGNSIKVVAVASDNSDLVEAESTPGKIYGKGTASDVMSFELNPEKAYMISIKGNEAVNKDIMLGNVRLYGASQVAGVAPKTPAVASYAYWETVKGPDMLTSGIKTVDGAEQTKPCIDPAMPWIVYVNPTSQLDNGAAEVQQSNRWTDLNPETGVKGEWLQVTGENGSVQSPVLSSAWGKYMKFYVAGTAKFGVYATGSASGSAEDGNRVLVHAVPFNSNVAVEAATEAGTIYGKGTTSDCVFVTLDPTEAYEIIVEGDPAVNKDIQLLAVTLQDAEAAANQENNVGTLNAAIAKAVKANQNVVELAEGQVYSLNGAALTGVEVMTIKANNATIKAAADGQIQAQKGIIINDAVIDATAEGAVAPIALASEPAAELAMWTAGVEEVKDTLGNVITPGVPETMKYANATFKGYEAELVELNNCVVMTANSLVRANKNWALRKLHINESVVEVTYKSGKAFINFEENGAGLIQDIDIEKSTLYADSANTEMRFLRYASQNDPWRVWGYEGEDKNATLCTWTMTNNTIVSLCGNKEFANNIKNTAATVEDWKGNIFVNTWRLQKVGSNNTRNFTAEDNFIAGGMNEVDGTDASKYATVDETMGIQWNFAETPAPVATDAEALKAAFGPAAESEANQASAGDPRWLTIIVPDAIQAVNAEAAADAPVFNVMGQRVAAAKGMIVKGGKLIYVK